MERLKVRKGLLGTEGAFTPLIKNFQKRPWRVSERLTLLKKISQIERMAKGRRRSVPHMAG